MSKPKIAISLDKSLLELVDSKVDGSVIRSRSQAMEFSTHHEDSDSYREESSGKVDLDKLELPK